MKNKSNIKEKKLNNFKSFFYLVKNEFRSTSFFGLKGSNFAKVLKILFLILVSIGSFYIFKFSFYLYEQTGVSITGAFVPLLLYIFLFASSFQAITKIADTLYHDPKLDILMTFPLKTYTIYFAKLFTRFLSEMIKSIIVVFPFLLAVYFHSDNSKLYGQIGVYLLRISFITLLIPFFTLFLGTIFSNLYHYIFIILKKNNILYSIFLISIYSLIFISTFLFLYNLKHANPNDSYIRFSTLTYRWVNYDFKIKKFIDSTLILKYFNYLIYKPNVIQKSFVRPSTLKIILIILGYLTLFLTCSLLINYFTYFELYNSLKMSKNKKHKESNYFIKVKSGLSAYFAKEFKIYLRNHKALFELITYFFLFPYLTFVFNYIFANVELTELGFRLAFLTNLFLGLTIILSSNNWTSLLLTKEGYYYQILKTLPGSIYKGAISKIIINSIFAGTIILLNFLIILITGSFRNNLKSAPFLLLLIFIVYTLISIFSNSINDIINPEFEKYELLKDETKLKNVKKANFIALSITFLISIAIGLNWKIIPYASIFVILIGTIILCFILFFFVKRIKYYFNLYEG